MAELLSIQVQVPLIKSAQGKVTLPNHYMISDDNVRTKKSPSTFLSTEAGIDCLPPNKACNIEFKNLSYSVPEGRRKCTFCFFSLKFCFLNFLFLSKVEKFKKNEN